MKEFREFKERKHEWDSDALDERPESVSDIFDQQDGALKEGDSPPVEGTPGSVSDIFDQQDEALKESDSPPLEKTPESVSDIFTKQIEALKEGNLTLDHIWEGNSSPLENVSEKKSKAKEIWENLTEEGKRLELMVKAELKKRHEQAQELDQLQKIIESSAKDKVKELKIQELTLSQEGQRLQELVKTIREHHAQDKDGDFLDKLFSQGAEKTTDAMTKIFEKADDSTKQTIQLDSNKLDKALFKPPEKSNHPESHQKPETPLSHDLHPAQASQAMEDRSSLDVPLENKSEKGEIEEKSIKDSREPKRYSDLLQNEQMESDPQITDFKNLEKFLNNDFIRNGYGVLIPFEIIKNNQLLETLKEFNLFENHSLKNPDLGPFLAQLKEKLQLNAHEFTKLIAKYERVMDNRINLHKLLHLPEKAFIKQKLTQDEIETFKKRIDDILINVNTSIYCQGSRSYEVNFYPENLEKIQIGNKDYVILPTSKWEIRGKREEIKQWVLNYYRKFKKAPTSDHLNTQFPGFLELEKRVYKRTLNQFLKECKIPPNKETEYDWTDNTTIKIVEDYIASYVNIDGKPPFIKEINKRFGGFLTYLRRENLTYNEFLKARGYDLNFEKAYNWKDPLTIKMVENWIAKYVENYGKTPTSTEVQKEFSSGFIKYLNRKKIAYGEFLKSLGYSPNIKREYNWRDIASIRMVENWIAEYVKKYGNPPPATELNKKFGGFLDYLIRENLTYNEFLKARGYLPNHEMVFNWEDPSTIKMVENWIVKYIKKYEGSPGLKEVRKKFGGFESYLNRKGITYNEFLEAHRFPIYEFEQNTKEGMIFDKIAKGCMKILYDVHQFRVYHPILEDSNQKYMIPDCIVHDFNKNPLTKEGKSIYLENEQKFDMIIEIKRSFGGVQSKEMEIYSTMAKKMKIYLLKGSVNLGAYERNGCQVFFNSKDELINQLRRKMNPSNRAIIISLIKKIQALDKRIDLETNRQIDEY